MILQVNTGSLVAAVVVEAVGHLLVMEIRSRWWRYNFSNPFAGGGGGGNQDGHAGDGTTNTGGGGGGYKDLMD